MGKKGRGGGLAKAKVKPKLQHRKRVKDQLAELRAELFRLRESANAKPPRDPDGVSQPSLPLGESPKIPPQGPGPIPVKRRKTPTEGDASKKSAEIYPVIIVGDESPAETEIGCRYSDGKRNLITLGKLKWIDPRVPLIGDTTIEVGDMVEFKVEFMNGKGGDRAVIRVLEIEPSPDDSYYLTGQFIGASDPDLEMLLSLFFHREPGVNKHPNWFHLCKKDPHHCIVTKPDGTNTQTMHVHASPETCFVHSTADKTPAWLVHGLLRTMGARTDSGPVSSHSAAAEPASSGDGSSLIHGAAVFKPSGTEVPQDPAMRQLEGVKEGWMRGGALFDRWKFTVTAFGAKADGPDPVLASRPSRGELPPADGGGFPPKMRRQELLQKLARLRSKQKAELPESEKKILKVSPKSTNLEYILTEKAVENLNLAADQNKKKKRRKKPSSKSRYTSGSCVCVCVCVYV